ncbi:MAG: hydroxymethylglutaryl-CoA lyase [Ottowia sp.]|uniref:hydroxymethylglutaryl-CoA lyase n=1 Tax=Ottowia sp. TaxID=1898956 RepID=UPI0039E29449
MKLPSSVTIVEVGPRDGLQSFPRPVDTSTKVQVIDRLSTAGLPVIEVTCFAHSRAIPNLADADKVFELIQRRPGIIYRGLVPNAYGAHRAVKARVDEMVGLTIMSPTYLRKNQNCTLDEAAEEAIKAFEIAQQASIRFVMALGGSFWCPYEGLIDRRMVLDMLARLHAEGIRRFYLAGSVGMEDPKHVYELFSSAFDRFPGIELGFHVHNLSGMATANVLAALQAGVSWIETSICGLGGGIAMPGDVGAVGNFPTEDLAMMLELLGIQTGVKAAEIAAASSEIAKILDIEPRSHVGRGLVRDLIQARPEVVQA